MIDLLSIIIITCIVALPVIWLCLKARKNNFSKQERSKQFLMPVIALVYSLLAMIGISPLNTWIVKFLNELPKWIQKISEIQGLPEKLRAFLLARAIDMANWLEKANIQFWVFLIANILIVCAYLWVKRTALSFIRKKVKNESSLYKNISGRFYEYFPEREMWCVREDYVQARDFIKTFYYAAVVLAFLLMVISRILYLFGYLRTMFYPVFSVILVGELYFYIDGLTKNEYVQNILGEDEDAYKIVNYSLLRKFLRALFGDKLLAENTSVNNELFSDLTNDEVIRELEENEDPIITNFAAYIKGLNRAGFEIDRNYLYSSLELLKGKSILFNNPFYNDLIPYAFYPMNRVLLSGKKVLIILGRHAIEEDIKVWLGKGIEMVTHIPFLWNIEVLNTDEQNPDIGIITRSDVLNIQLHNANAAFLSEVGYVVVIEPSKLMSTAQIGLNIIIKQCRKYDNEDITYCLCDKNCDGLVDAMSHVLMTSITEVSATKKHQGTSSYMCWQTDEEYLHHRLVPHISRYLGVGTELSFAALKNQVNKSKWYGGESFPVVDMNWVAKQYYYELMKYAGLPTSPEVMEQHFSASPNFWGAVVEDNNYFVVEDEFQNMFEVLRNFSTRSKIQGFINVISSEYLLKDYMADNASIFEADPKAIPYIVADYARTNRNIILRLVLMMSTYPVPVEMLEKELSLLGIKVFNLHKQLWFEIYKCYAGIHELDNLTGDYYDDVEAVSCKKLSINGEKFDASLLCAGKVYDIKKGQSMIAYSIKNDDFLRICVADLKSASYVAEDEKGKTNYLGSELSGQIYQKYLPGQFFTFAGKYYEMQYLTADGQILVRRASDHINGRPGYRQIREYTLTGRKSYDRIGACQNISGMKVSKEYADIYVSTLGYYQMSKYNDFKTAKMVRFEGINNGIPERYYPAKEILRIEFPNTNNAFSNQVRYTITLLFNEIFQTLFAENSAYICAVTDTSFYNEERYNPLTYSLKTDDGSKTDTGIYIVEDSQLDLGLIVAVERNLNRILQMIHDYLNWHSHTLDVSLNPPADPEVPVQFEVEKEETKPEEAVQEKEVKKGFWARLIEKIKSIFSKGKKEPEKEGSSEVSTSDSDESITESSDNTEAAAAENGEVTEEAVSEKDKAADEAVLEKTEVIEEITLEEDDTVEDDSSEKNEATETVEETEENVKLNIQAPNKAGDNVSLFKSKEYHERYYLLYGDTCEPKALDIQSTLKYLEDMGFGSSSLKQVRDGKNVAEFIQETFKPNKTGARYCDFCGTEILGVEYETLADGRDRCMNCGRTAIKTQDEFRHIFEDVKRNMESFFGIKINVGIRVEMVNSAVLHKRLGERFIPTPKMDGRILGVAISDKEGYKLLIENGSPRMASMLTMVHELTHIWQYLNWNDKEIRSKYGNELYLQVYEGMAKWVEIQYAYLINESAVAKREELITSYRKDEYGYGFLRYHANYAFSHGTVITRPTPFMNRQTPLDPMFCGKIQSTLG